MRHAEMATTSSTSLAALILGSGVVSAALTQSAAAILAWRVKRRAAEYLALRLALVVERFGEDCLDAVQEHDNFMSSRGEAGQMSQHLPMLGELPGDEAAWSTLPSDLSARVLGMEPRIRATNRQLDGIAEYGDQELSMVECRKQLVLIGCDSALLAKDVRRRLRLPAMQSKWDWAGRLDQLRVEIYRGRSTSE